MLGLFRPQKAEVLNHWYSLVPGFTNSSHSFYASIEAELKDREVPGLETSRVEFSEGGLLSAKREYLRMTRERLVFDICAAPFGTSYFFSCRFAELPSKVNPGAIAVLLFGFLALLVFSFAFLGFWLSLLLWPTVLACTAYTLRNAVSLGLTDLDAWLIKQPLFGPLYEHFFRKETYYRLDTRLMYMDTVNEVVKAKVEEVTGAKGIRLIRFNEHDPILGELYKPRMVETKEPASEPEPCLQSTVS